MNCKEFSINMSAYLDNLLEQHEKTLFEQHLQSCTKCAAEYIYIERAKKLLLSLDKQKTDLNFEKRVIEQIKNSTLTGKFLEFFLRTAKTTLLAAVLLFGVIVTFNFMTPSMSVPSHTDSVDAINNYVLKGNVFAKQSRISDAKIIQALLG